MYEAKSEKAHCSALRVRLVTHVTLLFSSPQQPARSRCTPEAQFPLLAVRAPLDDGEAGESMSLSGEYAPWSPQVFGLLLPGCDHDPPRFQIEGKSRAFGCPLVTRQVVGFLTLQEPYPAIPAPPHYWQSSP